MSTQALQFILLERYLEEQECLKELKRLIWKIGMRVYGKKKGAL